ncbi:MAG: D-Ala-D-Ala carboxypeptidase family metallohydrolase [Bacteroides sp.]|nr:D-Ala-D-Ala carboxypeptidase family metallohydrolase [Bacteroides sp.]
MGKYFTINELCHSATAKARNIPNVAGETETANLHLLIDKVLDPVREIHGSPILVNSGFRCRQLNTLIKGAKNSQHITGEAADITTGSQEENKALFDKIRESNIPFDQLIDESDYSWIHISYSNRHRRQILHL